MNSLEAEKIQLEFVIVRRDMCVVPMGEFSEKIKLDVKRKANFMCCKCHTTSVEVHHVIPQKDGGNNDIENVAPLCPNRHGDFGDNPVKRKWISQM